MWQQVISATPNVAYTGGWCLAGVQDSFGTDHPFPTALAQWRGYPQYQHAELPPNGVDVPVFFSLVGEPAGHVAVKFANGTVGSTTLPGKHGKLYIHPNLDDLIRVYRNAGWNIQYLGWSEVVGTKLVVKRKDEDVKPSESEVRDVFSKYLDSAPSKTQIDYYTQKDIRVLLGDVLGTTAPNADEIKKAFKTFLPDVKDDNAESYYQQKPKSLLYSNIAGHLKDDLDKEKTKPPVVVEKPVEVIKEVIKEVPVEKIVEKEVIKEVVKSDEERTFGDLLSAAIKKLLGQK